jgi:hypothetical protein
MIERRALGPAQRKLQWDALGPMSLLGFFWLSDLFIPYLYAINARPFERQPGIISALEAADLHRALFAALLYLICWLGGYWLFNAKVRWTVGLRGPRRPLSALRLLFNFALVLTAFLAIYALNPHTAFTSRMELTIGPWGKALFVAIGALFAAFWLSAIGLLTGAGKSRIKRAALVLVLSLCMIVILAPMEGRARMLIAVLYMIVVWHYFVRPLSTLKVWTILTVGLALAIALDYVRLSAQFSNVDPLAMAYGLAYGRQFDGALNLAMAVRAGSLDSGLFHHGSAWVADVLADLGIRTGGPDSRTLFMNEVLFISRFQAGFPMTRPGELFMAFGWAGIVVGAAALGAITRFWYNWLMVTRPFGAASPAIYFTFLMTTGLVTQKNYIFSSLVMGIVHVALILLLACTLYGYAWVAKRRPTSARNSLGRAYRHQRLSLASDDIAK